MMKSVKCPLCENEIPAVGFIVRCPRCCVEILIDKAKYLESCERR